MGLKYRYTMHLFLPIALDDACRQLEALKALLALADGPVAALLGSGWAVILRVSVRRKGG